MGEESGHGSGGHGDPKTSSWGGEVAASLRSSQRLLYSAIHYSHRFSIAV